MVVGHLHVQRCTGVAQVLASQHSTLLANEQCSRVCVTANVIGADRQVSNLEALDAVDVEAFVQHAVLDNAVAVPGRHGACAQGVPGGLNVAYRDVSWLRRTWVKGLSGGSLTLCPVLDVFDVFARVLEIFKHVL